MDTGGGEEGGGEIYGESNVETYNTICKTDNQWASCSITQGTQAGTL